MLLLQFLLVLAAPLRGAGAGPGAVLRLELAVEAGLPAPPGLDLVPGGLDGPERDLGEAGHGDRHAGHEDEEDEGENQSDVPTKEDT